MTNEQILKKAIQKAVIGGLDGVLSWISYKDYPTIQIPVFSLEQNDSPDLLLIGYGDIIHNHDFAKSFWWDKDLPDNQTSWQSNLQEMVLEEDKLKYLQKFL